MLTISLISDNEIILGTGGLFDLLEYSANLPGNPRLSVKYCLCSCSQRGLELLKNTAGKQEGVAGLELSLILLEWNGVEHFAIGME